MARIIIYQVLPRLFGANSSSNTKNGTIEQNGCGKLNQITPKALKAIRDLGCNYVWYTGVIEHANQTDYSEFGIKKDNPIVVKGKAGSPYAIKDYYDIDPDLAEDVPNRMKEFEQLILRTHKAGLKTIIDFVPNHVARQYCSDSHPLGIRDLGENDDNSIGFSKHNNFYYIPNQPFETKNFSSGNYDESYNEYPAKVTGNDCFCALPNKNDWYETVKLNYGIDYQHGWATHFYDDNDVPDTWNKMLDILRFWSTKGIDGFRCDMAEMVPCEFWNWSIPQIKSEHPQIIFIAEVYNPRQYRNYIYNGHFDYLYDKVGLYDTLRSVMNGESASLITQCWQSVDDISQNMLNFLENHDEQRIASPYFAGNAFRARPALLVSALMRTNPFMIYCGQELGVDGMEEAGFSGSDGRTTIFDYWTIDQLRRFNSNGKWDEKYLTINEKALRHYYKAVLSICNNEIAVQEGQFFDIMYANYDNQRMDTNHLYAFLRKAENELILIVANFDNKDTYTQIIIPSHAFEYLQMPSASRTAIDLISGNQVLIELQPNKLIPLHIPANDGVVLKIIL